MLVNALSRSLLPLKPNAHDNVFGGLILKKYRFMLFSFAPFVVTLADGNYGAQAVRETRIEIAESIITLLNNSD